MQGQDIVAIKTYPSLTTLQQTESMWTPDFKQWQRHPVETGKTTYCVPAEHQMLKLVFRQTWDANMNNALLHRIKCNQCIITEKGRAPTVLQKTYSFRSFCANCTGGLNKKLCIPSMKSNGWPAISNLSLKTFHHNLLLGSSKGCSVSAYRNNDRLVIVHEQPFVDFYR